MKLFFQKQNKKKGFTLVELLITVVIFVTITGVVLVNSNKFDSTVLLDNFAYDIALSIKQAQSYGVNVKESSTGVFSSGYGVYFDPIESNVNFILFNDMYDIDNIVSYDKKYNGSVTKCLIDDPECIQKYSLRRGVYIKSMCAGTDEADCINNPINQLSILFQRPSLEAKIYINGLNNPETSLKQYAKITLASIGGATSSIVVTSIGQIYVKK